MSVTGPFAYKVAVIGLGRVGGALLRALDESPNFEVRGHDRDAEVLTSHGQQGYSTVPQSGELACWAQATFVCVPAAASGPVALAALLAHPTSLVAVHSQAPMALVEYLLARVTPEEMGRVVIFSAMLAAAPSAHSLAEQVCAISVEPRRPPEIEHLITCTRLLEAVGASCMVLDVTHQAQLLARTRQLPAVIEHALASSRVNVELGATARVPALAPALAPPPSVRELLGNSAAVLSALDEQLRVTETLRQALADGDENTLARVLADGQLSATLQALPCYGSSWQALRCDSADASELALLGAQGCLVRQLSLEGGTLVGERSAALREPQPVACDPMVIS